MKFRAAFFSLLTLGLILLSLSSVVARGDGLSALHAQSAGFDAPAFRMFGGDTCGTDGPASDQGSDAQ